MLPYGTEGDSMDKAAGETRVTQLIKKLRDSDRSIRRSAFDELVTLRPADIRRLIGPAVIEADWEDRRFLLQAFAKKVPHGTVDEALKLFGNGPIDQIERPNSSTDFDLVAILNAELGFFLWRMGARDAALSRCEAALELAPPGLSEARARAFRYLGLIHREQRRITQARRDFTTAIEQFRRLGNHAKEAQTLDSLGSLEAELLNFDEAERRYNQSLAIKIDQDDLMGQAITLGNLGRIFLTLGEYDRALEYFLKDRRLATQIGDQHGQAVMANQLAEAYMALGSLDQATECIQEGIDAARKSRVPTDRAYSEQLQGMLALQEGEHEKALTHLAKAQKVFEKVEKIDGVARCELLVAVAKRELSELDLAESKLQKAIELFDSINDTVGHAESCFELSILYQCSGQREMQEKSLREGLEFAEKMDRSAVQFELFRMHAHLQAGRWLLDSGVNDEKGVEDLIERSYRTRRGLCNLILAEKLMDETTLGKMLEAKADIQRLNTIDLDFIKIRRFSNLITRQTAERIKALIINQKSDRVILAMADPLDHQARLQVELAVGLPLEVKFIPTEEIQTAIHRAYTGTRLGLDRGVVNDATDKLLNDAIKMGASDIHVETKQTQTVVRFRIDGVLQEVDRIRNDRGMRIISRLKVLSEMNIAERRQPQDGRLCYKIDQKTFNMRLSTLPCMHGEKLVVRIISLGTGVSLRDLGFDPQTVSRLLRVPESQEGLFLVVGPTGSGKSTTLSGLLQEVDAYQRSVFTVEDPVEIEHASFSQTQIHPTIGYGFLEALKSILRQDPDVILLGEMRDLESASIASRMALTGHLVFSTLHTYDGFAAITRLTEMGIPNYTIAAVLKGILAQRLVRKLCRNCRVEQRIDSDLLRRFDPRGSMSEIFENKPIYGPRGCEECRFTGYQGRLPIFELYELSPVLAKLIRENAPTETMRETAIKHGFRTIHSSALQRLLAGETSQEELVRVL